MTIDRFWQYKIIDGNDRTCSICKQAEPIIEEYYELPGELFCAEDEGQPFCIDCAKDWLAMNTGVNDAMLELRALERSYARSVASSIRDLFAGTTTGDDDAPWATIGAVEAAEVPPDGYRDVAPDRYGRRWVLARGLNFGECNLCHIGRSDLLGVVVDKGGEAHIEHGMCSRCAITNLEDAEALRLLILEAEAVLGVRSATASAEVSRLFLGFAPLSLAERSDAA